MWIKVSGMIGGLENWPGLSGKERLAATQHVGVPPHKEGTPVSTRAWVGLGVLNISNLFVTHQVWPGVLRETLVSELYLFFLISIHTAVWRAHVKQQALFQGDWRSPSDKERRCWTVACRITYIPTVLVMCRVIQLSFSQLRPWLSRIELIDGRV